MRLGPTRGEEESSVGGISTAAALGRSVGVCRSCSQNLQFWKVLLQSETVPFTVDNFCVYPAGKLWVAFPSQEDFPWAFIVTQA